MRCDEMVSGEENLYLFFILQYLQLQIFLIPFFRIFFNCIILSWLEQILFETHFSLVLGQGIFLLGLEDEERLYAAYRKSVRESEFAAASTTTSAPLCTLPNNQRTLEWLQASRSKSARAASPRHAPKSAVCILQSKQQSIPRASEHPPQTPTRQEGCIRQRHFHASGPTQTHPPRIPTPEPPR